MYTITSIMYHAVVSSFHPVLSFSRTAQMQKSRHSAVAFRGELVALTLTLTSAAASQSTIQRKTGFQPCVYSLRRTPSWESSTATQTNSLQCPKQMPSWLTNRRVMSIHTGELELGGWTCICVCVFVCVGVCVCCFCAFFPPFICVVAGDGRCVLSLVFVSICFISS